MQDSSIQFAYFSTIYTQTCEATVQTNIMTSSPIFGLLLATKWCYGPCAKLLRNSHSLINIYVVHRASVFSIDIKYRLHSAEKQSWEWARIPSIANDVLGGHRYIINPGVNVIRVARPQTNERCARAAASPLKPAYSARVCITTVMTSCNEKPRVLSYNFGITC